MIRLLVVDDSPLMRRLLGELFTAEGDFEVAFARDGVEALEQVTAFQPDVVTLDVQMPQMGGLECLDRLMMERPTPVVMASSVTSEGATEALRAVDLRALDFIAKPSGAVSLRMGEFGPPLVEKVRAAAAARLPKTTRLRDRVRARLGAHAGSAGSASSVGSAPAAARRPGAGEGLVLVGCSTGGPPALDALLEPLPASFPWPIVVAQHMPSTFTGALARRLDGLTELCVREVSEPVSLQPGAVYIARGDADVIITRRRNGLMAMSAPAQESFRWHPSVDRMVDSALEHVPAARLIGVLMTGMGYDGAAAMTRLSAGGGFTIAEAEETAVIWGMPGELVRAGGAGAVVPLDRIARRLVEAVPTR